MKWLKLVVEIVLVIIPILEKVLPSKKTDEKEE